MLIEKWEGKSASFPAKAAKDLFVRGAQNFLLALRSSWLLSGAGSTPGMLPLMIGLKGGRSRSRVWEANFRRSLAGAEIPNFRLIFLYSPSQRARR